MSILNEFIFKLKSILKGIYYNDFKSLYISESAYIGKGVSFFTDKNRYSDLGKIFLGPNVKIGSYSEISTTPGGVVNIKEYSTCNSNCKILGEVIIERYCLLSANIFISSGQHYAFEFPELIIKNQDEKILDTKNGFIKHSKRIHIEEDVWIGFGVYIAQGVKIGRGAVIGANSVVLNDIKPYEVLVGAPAKVVRKRVNFVPPMNLAYSNSEDWVYFYRGFDHKNIEDDVKNHKGVRLIDEGLIKLNKGLKELVITGYCSEPLDLKICLGNSNLIYSVENAFEINLSENLVKVDQNSEIDLFISTERTKDIFIRNIN